MRLHCGVDHASYSAASEKLGTPAQTSPDACRPTRSSVRALSLAHRRLHEVRPLNEKVVKRWLEAPLPRLRPTVRKFDIWIHPHFYVVLKTPLAEHGILSPELAVD